MLVFTTISFSFFTVNQIFVFVINNTPNRPLEIPDVNANLDISDVNVFHINLKNKVLNSSIVVLPNEIVIHNSSKNAIDVFFKI